MYVSHETSITALYSLRYWRYIRGQVTKSIHLPLNIIKSTNTIAILKIKPFSGDSKCLLYLHGEKGTFFLVLVFVDHHVWVFRLVSLKGAAFVPCKHATCRRFDSKGFFFLQKHTGIKFPYITIFSSFIYGKFSFHFNPSRSTGNSWFIHTVTKYLLGKHLVKIIW